MAYIKDIKFASLTNDEIKFYADKYKSNKWLYLREDWDRFSREAEGKINKLTRSGIPVLDYACEQLGPEPGFSAGKVEDVVRTHCFNKLLEDLPKRNGFSWFEAIEDVLFLIYRYEIQLKSSQELVYLRMTTQGDVLRFALGIHAEQDYEKYWADTYSSAEELYERHWEGFHPNVEDAVSGCICDDFPEYQDLEDSWLSQENCHEFQGFVISVIMAKVAMRLRLDYSMRAYITNKTEIGIDIHDSGGMPFYNKDVPIDERTMAVGKVSSEENNQALLLDMWADQLLGPGKFLLDIASSMPSDADDGFLKYFPHYHKQYMQWKQR